MPNDSKSLIAKQEAEAAAAPFLFFPSELGSEYIGRPQEQGQYTAERLFAERPEIYKEIVRLLAEGASVRSIKRRCKVHHKTIEQVRLREGETIDTLKKEIGGRSFGVARMLLESIEEDVMEDRIKPEAKAITLGILIEKGQLLTGGVTARVERQEPADEDAIRKFIESLPPAQVQTPGMGFQGEGLKQMADGVGEGSVRRELGSGNTVFEGLLLGGTDNKSVALPREGERSNALDNKSAVNSPDPKEGRGGSVSEGGGLLGECNEPGEFYDK